jgi:hypothetical protein
MNWTAISVVVPLPCAETECVWFDEHVRDDELCDVGALRRY